MSDPVAVSVEEVAQEQPAEQFVDAGILRSFKEKIFAGVNEAYHNFITHHTGLPIDSGMLQTAFRHFNDGIVWIEKAVNAIERLPVSSPVKEAAEVVETVIEGVQALEGATEATPAT